MREQEEVVTNSKDILLKAFREYTASKGQVAAIRELQEHISPYALSNFANDYEEEAELIEFSPSELQTIYQHWK